VSSSAMWRISPRRSAKELLTIEDSVFVDEREDGTTKFISGYRISFASGFRVEALSSRPENIRGLQGTVVIDEAAFHKNVRDVLDAVNALLIWGGKIRVISSHNGIQNPFNELIREADAGKVPFSVPYLFVRTRRQERALQARLPDQGRGMVFRKGNCLGNPDPRLLWYAYRQDETGARCDPGRGGRCCAHPRADRKLHVGRPAVGGAAGDRPDAFKELSDDARETEALEFCETILKPLLDALDPEREHWLW